MTLSEFKAWFEGFTEDMTGPPNKKQWERIQARVKDITGQSVSYPVYIDRYVRPLAPYWTYGSPLGGYASGQASGLGLAASNSAGAACQSFNSHSAMADVGRADARALAS